MRLRWLLTTPDRRATTSTNMTAEAMMAGIGSTAPCRSCSATAMSKGTRETTASAARRRLEMRPSAGPRTTSVAIEGWSAAAPHSV